MYRIMLLDDEENIVNALRRTLIMEGLPDKPDIKLQVEAFTDPWAALDRAKEMKFHLVVSDYRMPAMDGVRFLKDLRAVQPNCARLILSGYADLDAVIGAINEAQIFRFIAKPWHDFDLKSAIAQALTYHDLLAENQRLADLVREQEGKISRQELELRRLEEENPGLTKVNWGPNGEVLLDEGAA